MRACKMSYAILSNNVWQLGRMCFSKTLAYTRPMKRNVKSRKTEYCHLSDVLYRCYCSSYWNIRLLSYNVGEYSSHIYCRNNESPRYDRLSSVFHVTESELHISEGAVEKNLYDYLTSENV